jgi:hypothetical protein
MTTILPPANFLTLHYVYFIVTCLASSVLFYLTSTPWKKVDYVDAIFLCVSAMTGAGLNTVLSLSKCKSCVEQTLMNFPGRLINSEYFPASHSIDLAHHGLCHFHLYRCASGA